MLAVADCDSWVIVSRMTMERHSGGLFGCHDSSRWTGTQEAWCCTVVEEDGKEQKLEAESPGCGKSKVQRCWVF
jgi:hypothetical protein